VQLGPGLARAGDGSMSWAELAPLEVEASWESEGPTFGFGMHLVVARIDPGTGHVELERVLAGYDTGRALRPEGVEGQLVGGTVQGIGATLFEQLVYGEDAQPQSSSFVEYVMPTCKDVPRIETVVWQSADVTGNPLGVRGAGETGVAGIGAAIGNAIADALGGRAPTSVPISPEAVLEIVEAATPTVALGG
jgi:CO/xanthine dehydrogenase Mo-binding subunit